MCGDNTLREVCCKKKCVMLEGKLLDLAANPELSGTCDELCHAHTSRKKFTPLSRQRVYSLCLALLYRWLKHRVKPFPLALSRSCDEETNEQFCPSKNKICSEIPDKVFVYTKAIWKRLDVLYNLENISLNSASVTALRADNALATSIHGNFALLLAI